MRKDAKLQTIKENTQMCDIEKVILLILCTGINSIKPGYGPDQPIFFELGPYAYIYIHYCCIHSITFPFLIPEKNLYIYSSNISS